VELRHPVSVPPATLFHGTAAKNWRAISEEGLKRGRRHAVHLSRDIPTARRVGARHGKPVVLQVDAVAMHEDGHVFSIADNGVWLVEYLPPQYLSIAAEPCQ
jgi:putative RNA 2'-phosphotransferase